MTTKCVTFCKKIKFFKVTSDLSFRIGSSKLPEFAETQPTGPIML